MTIRALFANFLSSRVSAFASVPFAYQFEALAVSSIFAVIVNNVFLLLALLRTAGDRRVLSQASRRERRRPATPD